MSDGGSEMTVQVKEEVKKGSSLRSDVDQYMNPTATKDGLRRDRDETPGYDPKSAKAISSKIGGVPPRLELQ